MPKPLIIVFTFLIIIIFFVLLLATIIWGTNNHNFQRLYDNVILDNRSHYLTCNELPSKEKVTEVVYEHAEVVERIIREVSNSYGDYDINPYWGENSVTEDKETSNIVFSWNSGNDSTCNNGDIEITYNSHSEREIIEKVINSNTFFGIPYRLRNV